MKNQEQSKMKSIDQEEKESSEKGIRNNKKGRKTKESEIRKKNWNEKESDEGEKIIFSRENAAKNILQGGYQTSMKGTREKWMTLCIDEDRKLQMSKSVPLICH